MSRALNIGAPLDEVRAICAKHDAGISAIEVLPGGATRVVLFSGDGAALVKRAFGNRVITTPLARTPLALAERGIPLSGDGRSPAPYVPTRR